MSTHIRPTTDLAERALLLEDPGAAMALAQVLIDRPLMFNHHRGLWGYSGDAADGRPLTIQSTGTGGPSAAVVLAELIGHGLRRAVRVGTCAAFTADLGELIVVDRAFAADGTSRALGAGDRVDADAGLTGALLAAAPPPSARRGAVASVDLFYARETEARWDGGARWRTAGALAVDLETAALLALGAVRGIPVGCLLTVADARCPARRIEDAALTAALDRAGRIALGALPAGASA